MQVTVNGKSLSVKKDCNVWALLQQLSLGHTRTAVELNREIVPRSEYTRRVLQDNDVLEIVHAIGGG